MPAVHIFAVLSPAPGKVERLRTLLVQLCEEVHSKEDYTSRYLLTEQDGAETPDFCLIETYKSKDGQSEHSKTPHFKTFFGIVQEEGLLAKPPYISTTVTKAGFDLDHKLINSKI